MHPRNVIPYSGVSCYCSPSIIFCIPFDNIDIQRSAIPEMAYLITMTFATVTLAVLGFLLHSLWQYIAACLKQEAWEHHGQLCCSCLSSSPPGFLSGCTAAKERSTGFSGYLQHLPSTWNNSNWGEERIAYPECKWMCHMATVHVFMLINWSLLARYQNCKYIVKCLCTDRWSYLQLFALSF